MIYGQGSRHPGWCFWPSQLHPHTEPGSWLLASHPPAIRWESGCATSVAVLSEPGWEFATEKERIAIAQRCYCFPQQVVFTVSLLSSHLGYALKTLSWMRRHSHLGKHCLILAFSVDKPKIPSTSHHLRLLQSHPMERPLSRIKDSSSKLPVEVLERILSHTKDWELCHTLGFSHALPASSVWLQHATDLDWAVLSGSLALVKACVSPDAGKTPDQLQLSTWGARAIVRFGYIDTLTFLYNTQQKQLLRCVGSLLPTIASAWGRVNVLEWAQTRDWQWLSDPNPDPINEASRHGQTQVLDCQQLFSYCVGAMTYPAQMGLSPPHRAMRPRVIALTYADTFFCCFCNRVEELWTAAALFRRRSQERHRQAPIARA